MTKSGLMEFEQIWCVDFEFCAPDGERPIPICIVAHEVRRGETIRLWDEIQPVMLFTAVNRDGEVFIWPVRLPRGDGRTDQFMVSDMEAAQAAERKWTRRQWVPENKSHKNTISKNLTDEPMWPEIDFPELIKTGFKDKYLYNLDHPVLKRLRGEE